MLEGNSAVGLMGWREFHAYSIGTMARSSRKQHGAKKRKQWAKRTLFCTMLLPLLVSPLNALRIPSGTAAFAGSSGIRESSTRQRAVQIQEEVSQSQSNREGACQEEETPSHTSVTQYAFSPAISVKVVNKDDLHQTIPHRNGGYSNRFPLHAVTVGNGNKVNGEGWNGHALPHTRVINGVRLPPYDTVNGHIQPVDEEPPIVNGAVQSLHIGRAQPPQTSHNGSIQPIDERDASELDGVVNTQSLDQNVEPSENDDVPVSQQEQDEDTQPTLRKLWQRRHARTIEEGVRCEKTQEKTTQLSKLLSKAPLVPPKRGYFARTISGLITALAEEADGLVVDVDAQEETPLWRKKVDAIRINFSRLGFKPLRMGGLDEAIRSLEMEIPDSQVDRLAENLELAAVSTADEAFDRIDVDKSGALDRDEIAKALTLAASSDSDEKLLEGLASQLVELYDFNGDGVVDREEYQNLVADMATLRREEKARLEMETEEPEGIVGIRGAFGKFSRWIRREKPADEVAVETDEEGDTVVEATDTNIGTDESQSLDVVSMKEENYESSKDVVNISNDSAVNSVSKRGGSIVLEDLKLDLRQLIFGVVPVVKRVSLDMCMCHCRP